MLSSLVVNHLDLSQLPDNHGFLENYMHASYPPPNVYATGTFEHTQQAALKNFAKVETLYRNVTLWYAYKLGPKNYRSKFLRKRNPEKKPVNPFKTAEVSFLMSLGLKRTNG